MSHDRIMSVGGLCEVCENRAGKHTCDRCGAFVCSNHWEPAVGACLDCADAGEDSDRPSGFTLDG